MTLARSTARVSKSGCYGGAVETSALLAPVCVTAGGVTIDKWLTSVETLGDFISYLASSQFHAPVTTSSFELDEAEIIWNHSLLRCPVDLDIVSDSAVFLTLTECSSFLSTSPDLSKEPRSFTEAMKRPDADAWSAAMDREKTSLREMGAFEEVTLPKGE